MRLRLTEPLVTRAGELALQHGLRGYDAVHLATAMHWQTLLDVSITFVTFDRQLWEAGKKAGLVVWPDEQF